MSCVNLYQLAGVSPAPWYYPNSVNQQMSYVIVTENGKLIVIDGGYQNDAEYLFSFLKEQGGEKPTVSAWFLTHIHEDHTDAFYSLIKNHSDEITVEKVYADFPKREEVAQYESGSSAFTLDRFNEALALIGDVHIIPKLGDAIKIDNVNFEIIFAPCNRYMEQKNLNNSSFVLKMEACGQSVLFLADLAEPAGGDFIKEVAPDKIKADFVQMAHHGQYGVSRDVYEKIEAKCCLWPTPEWLWDNDAGKGYNTHGFQTIIVRNWMKELGVTHHVVAKNGTTLIKLPVDFSDYTWGQENDPE